MSSCYPDRSDRKCRICGSKELSRWYSGRYSRPPYYCSFRCRNIGERSAFLLISIVALISGIVLVIFLFQDGATFELLVPLIFVSIVFVSQLTLSVLGFKAYNESLRKKQTSPHTESFYPSNLERERIITPTSYAESSRDSFYPYEPQDEINIQPFSIKDDIDDAICMICKLNIEPSQIVYRCLNCNCYFHKEHLENWLTDSKICPVCEVLMKD